MYELTTEMGGDHGDKLDHQEKGLVDDMKEMEWSTAPSKKTNILMDKYVTHAEVIWTIPQEKMKIVQAMSKQPLTLKMKYNLLKLSAEFW